MNELVNKVLDRSMDKRLEIEKEVSGLEIEISMLNEHKRNLIEAEEELFMFDMGGDELLDVIIREAEEIERERQFVNYYPMAIDELMLILTMESLSVSDSLTEEIIMETAKRIVGEMI